MTGRTRRCWPRWPSRRGRCLIWRARCSCPGSPTVSRREVMVVCDLLRALLLGAMLLPGMSLVALIVLLYAVTAIQSPFDAARSAILRDVVQGERYALAAAVLQSTFRMMIVVGAAAGGLVVALVGARAALGIDA